MKKITINDKLLESIIRTTNNFSDTSLDKIILLHHLEVIVLLEVVHLQDQLLLCKVDHQAVKEVQLAKLINIYIKIYNHGQI